MDPIFSVIFITKSDIFTHKKDFRNTLEWRLRVKIKLAGDAG